MVINNLKLIYAQPAKIIHSYENMKKKLHRTNVAMRFNKVCRSNNLTPSYIKITINSHNKQCYNTMKAAVTYRIHKELKFLYKEKQTHERLYHLHLQCTDQWVTTWGGKRRRKKKTYL
jgi:phosphoserine aminotransferase